ncbi:uncharacterized protein [Penaeus vannamei]|uniref:uncharacterized protein n=1 Tax=Penaeus vannamei TaxID=6689 RepID=UPI00387F919D
MMILVTTLVLKFLFMLRFPSGSPTTTIIAQSLKFGRQPRHFIASLGGLQYTSPAAQPLFPWIFVNFSSPLIMGGSTPETFGFIH